MLRADPTEGGCGLSVKFCQVMFFSAVCASGISPLMAGVVIDLTGPRCVFVNVCVYVCVCV